MKLGKQQCEGGDLCPVLLHCRSNVECGGGDPAHRWSHQVHLVGGRGEGNRPTLILAQLDENKMAHRDPVL